MVNTAVCVYSGVLSDFVCEIKDNQTTSELVAHAEAVVSGHLVYRDRVHEVTVDH